MSLTDAVRNNILDALNAVAAFTAMTGPIKVRLMTANGSSSTAGTELGTGAGTGTGAGYTAGGITAVWTAGAAGASAPTATVRWDNLPVCTIVGAELWDSSGTPKRIQFTALTAPKTMASGDSFELPAAAFGETLT